jgi:hypothetical protein
MKISCLLVLLIACFVTISSHADQKFNPYTGKYETVMPDAELTFNPHSGQGSMSWLRQTPSRHLILIQESM